MLSARTPTTIILTNAHGIETKLSTTLRDWKLARTFKERTGATSYHHGATVEIVAAGANHSTAWRRFTDA